MYEFIYIYGTDFTTFLQMHYFVIFVNVFIIYIKSLPDLNIIKSFWTFFFFNQMFSHSLLLWLNFI